VQLARWSRLLALLGALAAAACGDDATVGPDGNVVDGGGGAPDAAAACALATGISYGSIGGLRAYSDRATLTPPDRYGRRREVYGGAGGNPMMCSNRLPACGGTAPVITAADLLVAFAAPDVVAALAEPMPRVYGLDTRPADGTVLEVIRADGRGFLLGRACTQPTGGFTCARPLTAGLARVADVLRALDDQQIATAGCEAFR
jgi:hypothetical protein